MRISGGSRFDDVGGAGHGEEPGRRRHEVEADGVGAHGHREEGVLLRGDAADLDEHAVEATDAARGDRRPIAPDRRRVTSDSPTSTAWKPASASRRASSGAGDAGLGHPQHPVGHRRAPTRTARSVSTSKVTRSRWFTPMRSAPDRERPLELGLVVHLDEHVEAELAGEGVEVDELVVVEGRHDEQHGVGAHDPGAHHVPGIDREVLAEHGQRRPPSRAARRSSAEPPNHCSSVSTDRQAAPPAA